MGPPLLSHLRSRHLVPLLAPLAALLLDCATLEPLPRRYLRERRRRRTRGLRLVSPTTQRAVAARRAAVPRAAGSSAESRRTARLRNVRRLGLQRRGLLSPADRCVRCARRAGLGGGDDHAGRRLRRRRTQGHLGSSGATSKGRIHYFKDGAAPQVIALPGVLASPLVFDFDGDGRSDIAFGYTFRGATEVTDGVLELAAASGFAIMLGQTDRAVVTKLFPTINRPAVRRHHRSARREAERGAPDGLRQSRGGAGDRANRHRRPRDVPAVARRKPVRHLDRLHEDHPRHAGRSRGRARRGKALRRPGELVELWRDRRSAEERDRSDPPHLLAVREEDRRHDLVEERAAAAHHHGRDAHPGSSPSTSTADRHGDLVIGTTTADGKSKVRVAYGDGADLVLADAPNDLSEVPLASGFIDSDLRVDLVTPSGVLLSSKATASIKGRRRRDRRRHHPADAARTAPVERGAGATKRWTVAQVADVNRDGLLDVIGASGV